MSLVEVRKAAPRPDDAADQVPDPPPRIYPSLTAWVEQWLIATLERELRRDFAWCGRWWAHPEAVARLWTMWGNWEIAVRDGEAAMTRWWLWDLDHRLPLLSDPDGGPFSRCRSGEHTALAPRLACEAAPQAVQLELITPQRDIGVGNAS